MRELDINVLLQKAEELKALFVLGQRVIPFLEEIFRFIKDTTPLLEEVNTSIRDNLAKMPKASKQLSKVTQATENATYEIMNTVDGMVYKSGIISVNFKNIRELLPKEGAIEDYDRLMNNSEELLKSIKSDAQNIMMSLQVQDITSQQIAAVNKVLETVQTKLGSIVNRFQSTEFAELFDNVTPKETRPHDAMKTEVAVLHRTIAFDPDAVESLENSTSRQSDVDQLMKDLEAGTIDWASFQQQTVPGEEAGTDASQTPSQDTGASSDDEVLTDQADIDALIASNFGNVQAQPSEDDDESFSQEDIDKFFGNN